RGPGPYLQRLYELLRLADADWAGMADGVAHTGRAGDPHATLLDIVGLHSGSVEFSQRYAESVEALYNKLRLGGLGGLLAALIVGGVVQSGTDLLTRFGYDGEEPPDLLGKLFFGTHNLLSGPIVDDRPLSESEPIRAYTDDGRNYLQWLIDAAGTSLDALYAQREFSDGAPTALLYLLARHALQLGYHDTGLRLRDSAGLLDADALRAAKREPTFIHIAERAETSESRYHALYTAEPAITGSQDMLIGEYIGASLPVLPQARSLRDQTRALERLTGASTARLERALAEHIDTCSYRLDAWLLGLVHYQLALMRGLRPSAESEPRQGIHLGAYAWLEDVRPDPKALTPADVPAELAEIFTPAGSTPLERDGTNHGWIHAPSLNHAVAAAVLRNGYLSDAGRANPDSLAVNLTSERVRTAMALLEGIRAGQRLGALLGYQFERGLHDRHGLAEVDKFIYPLRKAFPLASNQLRSTQTGDDVAIEAVEASNVLDGLKLVEHLAAGGEASYPFGKALPFAEPDEAAAINAEVARLLDSHDALADLALAEGVYQAVLGNYDRVASTYDAYSKGDFPPEPDIARTPASGPAIHHRVALHLRPGLDPGVSPIPGTPMSPRARLEPALNRWLVDVLPDLDDIGCVVAFRDAATGDLIEREVTMADLRIQPADVIRLLRDEPGQAMTELDDRVTRAAVVAHAPRPDAGVAIRYMESDTAAFSMFEVMPLARSLRRVTGSARPLRASDLALAGEASQDTDVDVRIDPVRITGVLAEMTALRADLDGFNVTLATLLDDVEGNLHDIVADADDHVHALAALLARAAAFAVPQAGWGFAYDFRQRVFAGLRERTGDLVGRWDDRLAAFDAALADEAALLPSAADEERFALLTEAERQVSTQLTSPLPALPADFRVQLLVQRGVFVASRNAFAGIAATTRTSVSDLLADARAAVTLTPVEELDADGFGLEVEVGEAVRFIEDAASVAAVVTAELDRRLALAQQRVDEHGAAAAPRARAAALEAAAKALLGDDVVVIAEFGLDADHASELSNAFGASAAGTLLAYLDGAADIDVPIDTWLYGAARTRSQLHAWEQTVMLAGALGRAEPELTPIQLPFRADDSWLALEFPPDRTLDSEHLCYTAHLAAPFDPAARQCGLLLDEWSEVIPDSDATTGIAFNYDRPNAEAPQAMLLVTPTEFRGRWRWDDLVDALHETLDLAKRRAVEPTHVDASPYAPFLPATVMAVTVSQLSISANLALNNNVQALRQER
ncbi:MAG TPA: hypothetical protein VML96_13700, partial [Egibacteraceae bacterium]|nr:hypothetical protein [Egibacteraceae bacterium]